MGGAGAGDSPRLAWDTLSLLQGWLDHLGAAAAETLTTPTPSRGRTLRNLTVNVFHPFELLPDAWSTLRFDWDPDGDERRERRLGGRDELVRWAEGVHVAWSSFVLERGDELGSVDPEIDSPRGPVRYSALLASQRWHAAFHYRQLAAFLGAEGTALAALPDLDLPADVF